MSESWREWTVAGALLDFMREANVTSGSALNVNWGSQASFAISADGRAIYVSDGYARPPRIMRLDLASGRRELWHEFTTLNPIGLIGTIDVKSAKPQK